MKECQIIFVVGNSCSGKSTLIKKFSNVQKLSVVDDYSALREIFLIDSLINKFSNKLNVYSSRKDFINELQLLYKNNQYTLPIIKQIVAASNNQEIPLNYLPNSISNLDGSYTITNQEIWHTVLRLLFTQKKTLDSPLIIEFARGDYADYLHHFKIRPGESYIYHINRLSHEQCIDLRTCNIIYVLSPLQCRIDRSYRRKAEGGHFVSPEAMTKIYHSDSFIGSLDFENGFSFVSVGDVKIPVYQLDNSIDLPIYDFTAKAESEFKYALQYFDMFKDSLRLHL